MDNETEVVDQGTTLTEDQKEEINNVIETTSNEQKDIQDMKAAEEDAANSDGELEESISSHAKSIEEFVSDLDSAETETSTEPIVITPDDIRKVTSDGSNIIGDKFAIDDQTCLDLLKLVEDVRDNKMKVTYSVLPEQVKTYVNNYLVANGYVGFSAETNQMRNTISDMLISEFISNIEMNHIMDDFNTGIEKLYDETGKELSPLIKEYNEDKQNSLKTALENVEDPDKKEKIEKVITAIDSAYSLDGLIEFAPHCKIKPFELEKPNKIFDDFLFKYQHTTAHIYDPKMLCPVLQKHLINNNLIKEDDRTSVFKFFIAFIKYCMNYSTEVPQEHAFMYYVCYNIVLLDIYKDDNYNEFAIPFLNNIMKVVSTVKCKV